MISVFLAAGIAFVIFKFSIREDEAEVDGFSVVASIAVPLILNLIISGVVGAFGLPVYIIFVGWLLYFAVPLCFLRFAFGLPWVKSSLLSASVVAIFVACNLAVPLALKSISA